MCRRANGCLSDQQWNAIQKLESRLDCYRDASKKWDDIVSSSKKAKDLLNSSERDSDIRNLYCRVGITSYANRYVLNGREQILLNCMGLELLECENIGIALDPLASLMNHSCDPNAVCLFDGTAIHIRSLKPIYPGQEILISYTDNTMDYHFRNHTLKSKWFFTCTCMFQVLVCFTLSGH